MAIIKTTNRSITGTILPANLGSGTASSSTVLYGDSTFKTEPAFDDNKLVNDISTLALHQATNNNSAKYNLTNSNVDVYQDSSAIANLVNVTRDTTGEYISSVSDSVPTGTQLYLKSNSATNNSTTISDSSGNNVPVSFQGNAKNIVDGNSDIIGTSAYWIDNGSDRVEVSTSNFNTRANFGTGAFTLAGYFFFNSVSAYRPLITFGGWGTNVDYNGWSFIHENTNKLHFYTRQGGSVLSSVKSDALSLAGDTWYHLAVTRDGSGNIKFWKNGTLAGTHTGQSGNIYGFDDRNLQLGRNGDNSITYAGRFDNIVINKGYDLYTSNFTPPTTYYTASSSATGNYQSTAQTANASVNKISGVVTYTNASGTNTLNTDIVLQVSANNGSNWSNATLTAAGTFSTGVLQAVTNDISVTAGTQLKYKIFFANQASGSKVARINGVSLSY